MNRTSMCRLAQAICVMLFLLTPSVQAQFKQRPGGCSLNGGSNLPGKAYAGNLYPALGRQQFDNYAWEESQILNKLFGTDAALFYMIEDDSPNAYASQDRQAHLLIEEGRPYCCSDGAVLLGTKLIDLEYRATKGTGLSLPAILAHEHAHILQFKKKCDLQGKWRELHADYLAGWFIAYRGQFPVANNVYQAMANFYYKGDYAFNSKGHHGTPEERANAFLAGYKSYKPNASAQKAYSSGIVYVALKEVLEK